jgi:hypothetical protein
MTKSTKSQDRTGRSRAVAELLPAVGGKAFRRFGFAEAAIVARWADIVGSAFAANASPESLRFPHGRKSGGTLTLAAHGAHALMMQHAAPQIIERVNRFFGYDAVSRIAIRQGTAAAAPRARREGSPPAELPADVRSSLRAITDDALRASLEELARQISVTRGPPVVR